MKALMKKHSAEGLWLEEVPVPEIGAQDILVKIRKTAICGSDVHIYNWDAWAQKTIPVPLVTGHEFVGEIVSVGKDVTHLSVGERVSGEGHISCGTCLSCRDNLEHLCPSTKGVGIQRMGAFAEYLCLPAYNACKIPDQISDEVASLLDPLGNAVHSVLAAPVAGQNVLITGAGPIGLMTVILCRYLGANHIVITDVHPKRLALAKKLGATQAVDVSKETFPTGYHFSIGLEMSGSGDGLSLLIKQLQPGGHIAYLGIPAGPVTIDVHPFIFKGLHLQGIYGRQMFGTWHQMINLLLSGLDITPIITHTYPYTAFETAFQQIREGNSAKVILDWV